MDMPQVHHPIAFCPDHGFFAATAFAMANSTCSFTGCRTDCPTCGKMSEVLSGAYQARGQFFNLLLDPSISKEALAALRQIAEDAQANRITPEEAKRRATEVAPKAGRLFDIADWDGNAKANLYGSIIAAIGAVATAYVVAGGPKESTTIERVIERTIIQQHHTLPKHNDEALPGLPGGSPLKTKI